MVSSTLSCTVTSVVAAELDVSFGVLFGLEQAVKQIAMAKHKVDKLSGESILGVIIRS